MTDSPTFRIVVQAVKDGFDVISYNLKVAPPDRGSRDRFRSAVCGGDENLTLAAARYRAAETASNVRSVGVIVEEYLTEVE